jgi:hypothetical protein
MKGIVTDKKSTQPFYVGYQAVGLTVDTISSFPSKTIATAVTRELWIKLASAVASTMASPMKASV